MSPEFDVDKFASPDIDECATDNGGCDIVREICNNNPGSFTCSCAAGWHGINCADGM